MKSSIKFNLNIFIVLSVFSTTAFAYPEYLENFSGYYSENGLDVTKFKNELRCQTCHTSARGGERNSYGSDIESALGSGNTWGINEFKDSDSDGFINLEEIFAQTAPGFAELKPAGRIEIKPSAKGILPVTAEILMPATQTSDCEITFKAFSFQISAPKSAVNLQPKLVSDLKIKVLKGEKITIGLSANPKGTLLVKCDTSSYVGSLTLAE